MRGRHRQTAKPFVRILKLRDAEWAAGEQVNNAQSGGINLNQLNRSIIFSEGGENCTGS